MNLILASFLLSTLSVNGGNSNPASTPRQESVKSPLRANYIVTAADDFIVEAYLNGKLIPNEKRSLLDEVYGATAEKIDVEVRKGDWLVFNVVNNQLRWNGSYYFAVAGCFAENEFGFSSQISAQKDVSCWCVCDSTRDIDRFISKRNFLSDRKPKVVATPWSAGDELMRRFAGSYWKGQPVWGARRNTWVKVIVE